MADTKELVVRMPAELHEQLKARAEADDRTVAATIRVALRRYLASDHRGPLTLDASG